MKKFTLITAALAALALISCQKENMPIQTNPQEDVWEIEIEGQTTKADITKTMILIVKPNEEIKATLKKNKDTYDGTDVTWYWTGGNVKATRTDDGSKKGVSYCSLTAQTSGSETVYVTASVGSAPGANIPTKSANVVVNEPEAVIKVTETTVTDSRFQTVVIKLTASLVFDSGIQGFYYSGEDINLDFNARCLLENLVDKVDCPSKPSKWWQDGGDTWHWEQVWENTSSGTLNASNTSVTCSLDWSQGVCDGWADHWGAQPTPPYIKPGSTPDFTLGFFGSHPDHIEDAVVNETSNFIYIPR